MTAKRKPAPKPAAKTPPPGGTHAVLPLSALVVSPDNPRGTVSPKDPAVLELAASIKAHGLIQPITCTKGKVIIGGHRRRVAAQLAGLKTVPVIVYPVSDAVAGEMRVVENLQREDLPPLEEARGIAALLAAGRKPAEIADRLGKPLSWVVRRSKIIDLAPRWKKLAAQKDSPLARWSAQMFEEVAALAIAQQNALLDDIEGDLEHADLSDLRERTTEYRRALAEAPFDVRDATLVPKAGSCLACPKRASCKPGLFAEVGDQESGKLPANDLCLDADCFNQKRFAVLTRAVEQTGAEKVLITGANYTERNRMPKPLADLCGETYSLERCSKGTPGAIAAVDATTLKVSWYAKPGRSTAKKSAGAGDKTDAPAAGRSLEDRRAGLEKRRLVWAVDHFGGQFNDECPKPASVTVIKLAAVFGLPELDEVPAGLADAERSDYDEIARAMWPGLKARINHQLKGWRVNGPDSEMALRAKWAADETYEGGWAAILDKAAAEIPEPKSWAKLEAQGAAQ